MTQPTAQSLPPRKWYTLEQAVRQINKRTGEEIEVADLLHYWITRQLEICVNCHFGQHLEIANNTLNSSDVLYFHCQDEINESYIFDDVLDMSLIDLDKINKIEGQIYISNKLENRLNDPQQVFIYRTKKRVLLNGFLSIIYIHNQKEDENIYIEQGLSKNLFILATPSNNENRILFEISTNNKITIPIEHFYILDKDLNDLLNNQTNPPKPKQEKRTHTKTLNSQAEFIRNLITIHYGEKVANNIRNELENPRSRITCDFEKNGLIPAHGKTVHGWINQP